MTDKWTVQETWMAEPEIQALIALPKLSSTLPSPSTMHPPSIDNSEPAKGSKTLQTLEKKSLLKLACDFVDLYTPFYEKSMHQRVPSSFSRDLREFLIEK